MTLQKYRICIADNKRGWVIAKNINGEIVKASEALAALAEKDAEIARLRKVLEFIASSIPTGNGYSHAHLAKKTLEPQQ